MPFHAGQKAFSLQVLQPVHLKQSTSFIYLLSVYLLGLYLFIFLSCFVAFKMWQDQGSWYLFAKPRVAPRLSRGGVNAGSRWV